VFVVGASNLFTSLQDALNSIWGVEKTKGGWLQVVRDRAVSGGMIVVIGLILIMTFNRERRRRVSHFGPETVRLHVTPARLSCGNSVRRWQGLDTKVPAKGAAGE
jgi:membrane protein